MTTGDGNGWQEFPTGVENETCEELPIEIVISYALLPVKPHNVVAILLQSQNEDVDIKVPQAKNIAVWVGEPCWCQFGANCSHGLLVHHLTLKNIVYCVHSTEEERLLLVIYGEGVLLRNFLCSTERSVFERSNTVQQTKLVNYQLHKWAACELFKRHL
uniref:Uncharacterized protein n=1 Tax=Schistocephalus solidus TaxID=70667 RepID=A0A0V0J155_SCHSO